jgi:putative ABC transport system permease protein
MLNFLIETFVLGLKNLHLHKLRSTLTALGIIIGVSAFVIMVAIGEGTKQAAIEQMNQLGARNILIRSVPPPLAGETASRTQRVLEYGIKRLDVDRMEALRSGGVMRIVPLRNTEQRVVRGDTRVAANAIGTTPEIFTVINLPLERGRYFYEEDHLAQKPVCVLGALAAQQLFPYQEPLGQYVTVGDSAGGIILLNVIGVLEKTGLRPGGGIINREIDQDIYFPLTLAQNVFRDNVIKRLPGSFERKTIELTEVWLQAQAMDSVERLASVAENIMKIGHGQRIDYEVKAPIEILRSAERTNRMFNFILGGISCFSLVVGGIGIMNIMLASVTERTREIGIRRALGAKRRHIILQFLIETMVISLAGGLVGVVLAGGFSVLLNQIQTAYPTQLAPWSIVTGFIFSGLVGIGFGLYPAVKAARMDPIEALRHE